MIDTAERDRRTDVLELVCANVPEYVLELAPRRFVADGRCIASTRIGLEVLRYFEIPAELLVTRALAANAEWREWRRAGEPPPMPDEAWSLLVGYPTDGPGIDAHAVIRLPSPYVDGFDLLLDLDAGQFARAERGILLPDPWVLLPLGELELPDGRVAEVASRELPREGLLQYAVHPEHRQRVDEIRRAPDWKVARKDAGPLIRLIRDRLEI